MISYSAKCAEQLMALEGSPMGESLRKAIASQTGDGAAKRGASSQCVLSIACASGGVHLLNLLTCFSGRYSPRLPSSALIVNLFLHHVSTLSSSLITTASARCSAQALHRIAHHIALKTSAQCSCVPVPSHDECQQVARCMLNTHADQDRLFFARCTPLPTPPPPTTTTTSQVQEQAHPQSMSERVRTLLLHHRAPNRKCLSWQSSLRSALAMFKQPHVTRLTTGSRRVHHRQAEQERTGLASLG
jgi:hypothetical protein